MLKIIKDNLFSRHSVIQPIYVIEIKIGKRRYRLGWMVNCGIISTAPWYFKIGHIYYNPQNGYFKFRILWLAFGWY